MSNAEHGDLYMAQVSEQLKEDKESTGFLSCG